MRTTGYIGQQDEAAATWMSRVMNRSNAIKEVPEHLALDYYNKSLRYSRSKYPNNSYKLAENAIKTGNFYRSKRRFNVVLYPDQQSVLRSPLPADEIFLWYPGKRKKSEFTIPEFDNLISEECDFDEYLNTQTHVSEIDFLAEILFAPKCCTVEKFSAEAAALALHSLPYPTNMCEWASDTIARKAASLAAAAALEEWLVYMRDRIVTTDKNNRGSYTRLSWYYGNALKTIAYILRDGSYETINKKLRKQILTDKYIESLLNERSEEFSSVMQSGENIRIAAADILYSAYVNMEAGAFSKGSGGRLFMGGSAKSISCITGGMSESTEYLAWLLKTAALYPDAMFYALSLEKWNKYQLDTLAEAVKNTNSANLLVWTSADHIVVPEILLRGDYITSEDIDSESGIIMYKKPRQSSTLEIMNSYGILYENAERIPHGENVIGSVDPDLTFTLRNRRQDPMYNTPADYGNKIPSVAIPYELLPEDKIEEAREMILYMNNINLDDVNKPSACTNRQIPPINVK